MMKEYEIKSKHNQPSFIGGWIMDEKICDGLIDFFNNDKTIKINRGCIGSIGNVDTSRKIIDIIIFLFLKFYIRYDRIK